MSSWFLTIRHNSREVRQPPVHFLSAKGSKEPLYYLFGHGKEVPERLTAEFQIRPLVISANVFSEVRFSQQSVAVTQTLEFDINIRGSILCCCACLGNYWIGRE